MIHELLIGTDPKARPVLTWNMLIGGPNQSYKVNFKEPPLVRGKISKRTFAFCSVNTFPEFIRKKFCEGTLFSRSLHSPCQWLKQAIERRGAGTWEMRISNQVLFGNQILWLCIYMIEMNLWFIILTYIATDFYPKESLMLTRWRCCFGINIRNTSLSTISWTSLTSLLRNSKTGKLHGADQAGNQQSIPP